MPIDLLQAISACGRSGCLQIKGVNGCFFLELLFFWLGRTLRVVPLANVSSEALEKPFY